METYQKPFKCKIPLSKTRAYGKSPKSSKFTLKKHNGTTRRNQIQLSILQNEQRNFESSEAISSHIHLDNRNPIFVNLYPTKHFLFSHILCHFQSTKPGETAKIGLFILLKNEKLVSEENTGDISKYWVR